MNQEDKTKFALENFKEMRKEINLRITTHTHLVTAKIVTSGAILSFLLSSMSNDPKKQAIGSIVLPLVCLLYDMMIAKNIGNIHKIGLFIRDYIEKAIYDLDMWETIIGQKKIKERCYGLGDIFFLSLFTIGITAISIYLLYVEFPNKVSVSILIAFLALITFVVQYMRRTILYWEEKKSEQGH